MDEFNADPLYNLNFKVPETNSIVESCHPLFGVICPSSSNMIPFVVG